MTRTWLTILAVLAAPLCTLPAQGQSRPPLKRGFPAPRQACAPVAAARAATADQRRTARGIAQRAQQSAILGDRAAARDLLRQATALDPTNPDLAYQLARAQEALGTADEATAAYCRFLALSPNAPEATEVRERLAALTRNTQTAVSEKVLMPFRTGAAHYDAGRYAAAAAAFGNAISLQPDWAEAYYDRAQANALRGQRELAIADLRQYLRLRPEAEDRAAVIRQISGLRGGPLSPATALGLGLVIPGAGQMYTGRAVFGVLTLAAAGGAIAYALQSGPVTKEYTITPTDPFGNPLPSYVETRTETGRPHLVPGLAALGALAGATAIEAFVHARRVNASDQRLSAGVEPFAGGLALRVTLR